MKATDCLSMAFAEYGTKEVVGGRLVILAAALPKAAQIKNSLIAQVIEKHCGNAAAGAGGAVYYHRGIFIGDIFFVFIVDFFQRHRDAARQMKLFIFFIGAHINQITVPV